ncbi:interleukin-1 receptor-associated kinase-like 2 isoform X1 [Varanus komodoensis]|nr:interleukin-1 receptor-associated kinase-like 2 isoform X1 [Varanus komodoensis]
MAKGEESANPTCATQPEKDMARQPPPPSPGNPAQPSPYIHSMPAWVLEDFCQKMDCLSDYDWMRFASYVITDQTELRKIKCMEKAGISITRELMWWWGVRLATVQQLLDLLQELQLYRAAQVIADWSSLPLTHDSIRAPLEAHQQEKPSVHPTGNKNKGTGNEPEKPALPNADPVFKAAAQMLPLSLPPTSMDLPHSLHSNQSLLGAKPGSSSIPQQETPPNLQSASLLWTPQEVENATSGFSAENRISEGIFATTYKGWKDNTMYVVKKLKEADTQRFFRTEVQICFRCCHPNILRLLGFSVDTGFHCLIYPYMPNGSLMDQLQCQGDFKSLQWDQCIRISLGLIQALQYLHHFGIIHGNVKSSNVLLDANFTPQLGHSGLRLHPVKKKSEYAVMKTKVLQASLAYFPEDFVRHGQLTEKVDIFGCGIILAEILTGMKAMDEERHPVFLKDALLEEIQMAKEVSCSKERTFEKLAAAEICHKYQDKQAVQFPPMSAVRLATAVCVCLRKKNADLAEAYEIMEVADHPIQYQKMPEGSRYFGFSDNTPEETNDEPASPFIVGLSDDHNDSVSPRSLNCADLLPPLIRVVPPETYSGQMLQVPCESDESSNFSWDPMEDVAYQPPRNSHPDLGNAASAKPLSKDPEDSSDFRAENMDCDRTIKPQEMTVPSSGMLQSNTKEGDAACSSQASAKEIKINDKKKKMMERFLLYEENKINSHELFESSI